MPTNGWNHQSCTWARSNSSQEMNVSHRKKVKYVFQWKHKKKPMLLFLFFRRRPLGFKQPNYSFHRKLNDLFHFLSICAQGLIINIHELFLCFSVGSYLYVFFFCSIPIAFVIRVWFYIIHQQNHTSTFRGDLVEFIIGNGFVATVSFAQHFNHK